ncbi:MAG: hypothetical protein M3Y23_05275 [Actinomycetota bacterium]|nr:hypothetical protein [Actinomycetota bacterium]
MNVHDLFLFFGIGSAVIAVTVSIIGLRAKNFPSRNALIALIALAVVFVVGTGYYGVQLQIEEAEEREHGDEHIVGEEASVSPVVIPARLL